MIEDYLKANNTCALATGAGNYVRCTPIEYSYHDGCFWMFSEGGRKFIGLAENPNVCLAIYDPYQGFGNLRGIQVMGHAELVEPFSEPYCAHAAHQKIPLSALQKLSSPMHLIRVRPTRIDCLFSEFKELGCGTRQTLILEEPVKRAGRTSLNFKDVRPFFIQALSHFRSAPSRKASPTFSPRT